MSRRTPARSLRAGRVGRVQILVLVLMVSAMGAVACGSEEAARDLPSTPAEADSIVVRVSGTEGVAYEGRYGSSFGESTLVEETTIKDEPAEYEIDLQEDEGEAVIASFHKTQPGTEQLKVQIVADGEVAVESSTYVEDGSVFADWGLENLPMPELPPLPEMPEFEPPPMPEFEDPPPEPQRPPRR